DELVAFGVALAADHAVGAVWRVAEPGALVALAAPHGLAAGGGVEVGGVAAVPGYVAGLAARVAVDWHVRVQCSKNCRYTRARETGTCTTTVSFNLIQVNDGCAVAVWGLIYSGHRR